MRIQKMTETERIAYLLKQTFEGKPYFGPSVLGALKPVTAEIALQQPSWSAHNIWQLVTHLTAELIYARAVIEGTAGLWESGKTTWPEITATTQEDWRQALQELKKANRALVRAIQKLDDSILDKNPIRVRGPYYLMLHGTLQHNIYHAGQISLLTGQIGQS